MLTIFSCLFVILLYYFDNCLSQQYGTSDDDYSKDIVFRIVNGEVAELGDVPYQISFSMRLGISNMYRTFCGGAIIHPKAILSAAHCFQSQKTTRNITEIFAVAGSLKSLAEYKSSDSIENGQWRRLTKVAINADYKFPFVDITLVLTRDPFRFNEYVNLIPCASRFQQYQGSCRISGYGRINLNVLAECLYLANVEMLSTKACNKIHHKIMIRFLCTSNYISDVAKGDSGGPLVCFNTKDPNEGDRGILVGIVSGKRHARSGNGSFFTRVSEYHDQINEIKRKYINETNIRSSNDWPIICTGFILVILMYLDDSMILLTIN